MSSRVVAYPQAAALAGQSRHPRKRQGGTPHRHATGSRYRGKGRARNGRPLLSLGAAPKSMSETRGVSPKTPGDGNRPGLAHPRRVGVARRQLPRALVGPASVNSASRVPRDAAVPRKLARFDGGGARVAAVPEVCGSCLRGQIIKRSDRRSTAAAARQATVCVLRGRMELCKNGAGSRRRSRVSALGHGARSRPPYACLDDAPDQGSKRFSHHRPI